MKKISLALLFLAVVISAAAQHIPGSWRKLPLSGLSFSYIQDTPARVFYLTGGQLYSYDKADAATTYYVPGDKISDSGISLLKYNSQKGYMLLAYTNGNIDLIYDDGRLVNLPEIKSANLISNRTINNVQFGHDRIYAATAFGIVVFDDENHTVVESGIYNENIPAILELGDYIAVWRKDPTDGKYKFAYSPKADRHNTIDTFTIASQQTYANLMPVSDNSYLTLDGGNVALATFDPSNTDSPISVQTVVGGTGGTSLNQYAGGYHVVGNNKFYLIDPANPLETATVTLPSGYTSQLLSFWDSPEQFWAANASGVGCYSLANGSVSTLIEQKFPDASVQPRIRHAEPMPNSTKVYLSECALSYFYPGVAQEGNSTFQTKKLYHELYDWSTGEIIPNYALTKSGTAVGYGGAGRAKFIPNDSSVIILSTLFYGVSVYKDGYVCEVFRETAGSESPLNGRWGSIIPEMAYDNNGNLWAVLYLFGNGYIQGSKASPLKILRKEALDKISKGDYTGLHERVGEEYTYWLQPQIPSKFMGERDAKLIFSSKTNKGIFFNGNYTSYILGIDTNGTTDIDDDTYWEYAGFSDQTGAVGSDEFKSWLVEDLNGWIWTGSRAGVYVIKDLDQIADGSSNYLNVVRPEVRRNDGTDNFDYLLSSDQIICIAVDRHNRKWIATSTSGLYCVNEDGSEIIYSFNKDNSPLVSDVVTMVTCDPNGEDVLIGTPEGLYVYSPDAAPAAADYSAAFVSPNPVSADYTGWITINGLMDNSLIKIVDASGREVWSGNSEGGMAVWDGCGPDGHRVPAGLYTVNAAQSDSDIAPVTKVVFVK